MTLSEKADRLLAIREDLYEMHFHEVDRKWLIDAMVDFAENNTFPLISDEEILKAAKECVYEDLDISVGSFELGAKWYREQLKLKNMKEHFLSYEQALAVKELGFDEATICVYNSYGHLKGVIASSVDGDYIKKEKWEDRLPAPLKSQFFKLLNYLKTNNMKLYTEEQVRETISNTLRIINSEKTWTYDDVIDSLTPIELPSDEEIQKEADGFYGLEPYNTIFVQGAKYMRDKIRGGNK